MPNTVIFQNGLDYASSASPSGTLIAPLYWVPIYDSRIDGLIHDSVMPVSAFSACVNVSATSPTGEIIWNVDGITNRYAMSDINKSFILSGSNTTLINPKTVAYPIQSQHWQINQLNGTPLANHFSATEASFNPANKTWITSAAFAAVAGNNTPTESGRNKYFPVIDYYPVSADAGDSKLRGMVKCRLAKDIGTVKFNKVALYITSFINSGTIESPNEPVLFAECQLKTTVIKTSMGTNGFDDVTVDVQIDLHSIEANWADVFFSTSGDYWSRVPDGIYYPERVGIGSFIDSILSPQASLHVRRTRDMVRLGITDAPVARFDFNDTNYFQIDISDTGIVHQTFESDYGHIGLYYKPLANAIYPDAYVTLGTDEVMKRFGAIYLDAGGINIIDSSNTNANYLRAFLTDGIGYIEASDNVSMTFNMVSENPAISERAYIEGADIRKRASLINYTLPNEYNNDYIIMAGLDENNSVWYSIEGDTSQYGVTHKNIIYMIDNPQYYEWLSTIGKVKIYGRGEIDLNGPVMLDALAYNGETSYSYGAIMTRNINILMIAGLATDPNSIIAAANEATITPDSSTTWGNLIAAFTNPGSYQIVGRIHHSEDLRPLVASTSVIGVPALVDPNFMSTQNAIQYKKLHVDTIGAYRGQTFGMGGMLYDDDRVSTIYAKDIGTTEEVGGLSRINRMAMIGMINSGYSNAIGTLGSGFDFGYISNASDVGDTTYPEDSSGVAYPFVTANYPRYYGLWPKNYIVLGNRKDMLNSVAVEGDPLYPSGKSTIDLICTRFMSMTNKLKFEGAFDITGRYRTGPGGNGFNYFPGTDATLIINENDWAGSAGMPGIHKIAGSPGVTLGDTNNPLDYAFINTITANSLTLTGSLIVGAITFPKTNTWSPFYTATVPDPTTIITDGQKPSIITDVIKIPMSATAQNKPGSTPLSPPNRVFMNYQFINRVVTGYIDTITNYTPPPTEGLLYPIYNVNDQSCLYVDTKNLTYKNLKWQANQTITFTPTDFNTTLTGAPNSAGLFTFNIGQYVIITTASPQTYKRSQATADTGNMLYGIVTAFTPNTGGGTYSVTVKILYYRLWDRGGSYTIGNNPITGTMRIITAMPFLLPSTNVILPTDAQKEFTQSECVYTRWGLSRGLGFDDIAKTTGALRFTDIGIDTTVFNPPNHNFSFADTIQPFTFLTIDPTKEPSIDLIA